MIHVITGLPGSFKTTWTLREVCGSGFADRRIFAHGVNGPQVDRIEVISADQVRDWRKLPAGAVVLVDEAQKLFPARGMHSGKPPQWIEDLAEHRHDGYDFLLLTQHPTFIDPFVRKLAGRHTHLARRFGMERANVFQWEEVQSPEENGAKAIAVRSTYVPEPADYARHTSATQHTHKRRLPWKKLSFAAAAAAAVIVCGVLVYRHLTTGLGVVGVGAPSGTPGAPERSARRAVGKFWTASSQKPRDGFEARPESAPIYDELQIVKSQPRLAGCADFGVSVAGKPACYCTSGQGAILTTISVHQCRSLIRSGWHDETRETPDSMALQIARLNALDAATGGGAGGEGPQGPPPAPAALPVSSDSL